MKATLSIISVVLALAGCANPINQHTATNYYQSGEAALANHDYLTAKESFRRALINARLGHMGPEAEGQVLMKLDRVLGNLCEHDQAEEAFSEAVKAYDKAYGDHSPRTFVARGELAQHSYDIGHYANAVRYFRDALPLGEEMLEAKDPVGYSYVLDDYADALARVGDTTDSSRIAAKATALRAKVSSTTAVKGNDYTRYPRECKKPNAL
jgi:tetratricopeptide (TPR) repeat protein